MVQVSGDTWVIVIAMFVLLFGLGSVIGSMAPNGLIKKWRKLTLYNKIILYQFWCSNFVAGR